MIPGEYFLGDGDIEANVGRRTLELTVENTGDRPIQVGSHFHFFEVNRALRFDRSQAFGMRLNVAAGTAVRFEPGDTREVDLVPNAGRRIVTAGHGMVGGELDRPGGREAFADVLRDRGVALDRNDRDSREPG